MTADTPMYRDARQPWLHFALGSLVGHSLRPWPITLLYAVAPTDTVRVLAQFAIATCCWAYCIWQFGRLSPHPVAPYVAGLAVAALALTMGVSGFDVILGSESLTVSLVALYVGALLSLCDGRGGRPTVAVAFVAATLVSLLRAQLLPLVLGATVVAFVARRDGRERRAAGAMTPVVVLATLSVAAMAYGWTYNAAVDRTWGDWRNVPGLNGRTLTQYYLAAYHTPSGPAVVAAMVRSGAPACLEHQPTATATTAGAGPDPMDQDRQTCPDGQVWLSHHFVGALAADLATHPVAARRYFADALGDESLVRTDGAQSLPAAVPPLLTDAFFSSRRGFPDPLTIWSVAALVSVLSWLLQNRRRPQPLTPREVVSPFTAAVGFTAVVGYVALVGTALLSATDASRVALPVTVLLRLVLLAVVVRATVAAVELHRLTGRLAPEWPDGDGERSLVAVGAGTPPAPRATTRR